MDVPFRFLLHCGETSAGPGNSAGPDGIQAIVPFLREARNCAFCYHLFTPNLLFQQHAQNPAGFVRFLAVFSSPWFTKARHPQRNHSRAYKDSDW
jgi:hypothetical protein